MNGYKHPLTGPTRKEYGPHEYADHDGTSDCKHKPICGAWMGPTRSEAKIGIDPGGCCPGNPVNGEFLGKGLDVSYVIEQRIALLEQRASDAERKLKSVEPGTIKLAEDLAEVRGAYLRTIQSVADVSEIAMKAATAKL